MQLATTNLNRRRNTYIPLQNETTINTLELKLEQPKRLT